MMETIEYADRLHDKVEIVSMTYVNPREFLDVDWIGVVRELCDWNGDPVGILRHLEARVIS